MLLIQVWSRLRLRMARGVCSRIPRWALGVAHPSVLSGHQFGSRLALGRRSAGRRHSRIKSASLLLQARGSRWGIASRVPSVDTLERAPWLPLRATSAAGFRRQPCARRTHQCTAVPAGRSSVQTGCAGSDPAAEFQLPSTTCSISGGQEGLVPSRLPPRRPSRETPGACCAHLDPGGVGLLPPQ